MVETANAMYLVIDWARYKCTVWVCPNKGLSLLCWLLSSSCFRARKVHMGSVGCFGIVFLFGVKKTEQQVYIIETKGREDLNDIKKINRLVTWCNDVNKEQKETTYTPIYIEEEIWKRERSAMKTFEQLVTLFTIEEAKKVK